MLSKLFKYEFKALFRWLAPCYIFSVIFSFLTMILVKVAGPRRYYGGVTAVGAILRGLATASLIFWYIIILAVSVLTMFLIAYRFYKNMYSNEGYITLTLPFTADEHLFAKLTASFTAEFVSLFVVLISVVIVAMGTIPGFNFAEIARAFSRLGELIEQANLATGGLVNMLIFQGVIMLICSAIYSILMFYSAISLGQLSNKHKIGMAIVAYIGIYIGIEIILTILTTNYMVATIKITNEIAALYSIRNFFWMLIGLEVVLSVGFYFVNRYILNKKVNLQ